jgi:cytochrome c-type biogenesis protein CcmH
MIRAMVERLATRMKTSPNDADGWRRLAHAYNVLGEPEKAQEAIAHAVRLKPNDVEVRLTLAETKRVAARASAKR